ncbi:unnamed protein product [Rotaria socialis]
MTKTTTTTTKTTTATTTTTTTSTTSTKTTTTTTMTKTTTTTTKTTTTTTTATTTTTTTKTTTSTTSTKTTTTTTMTKTTTTTSSATTTTTTTSKFSVCNTDVFLPVFLVYYISATTTTTGLNIYVAKLTYSAAIVNNWVQSTHSYVAAKSSGLSLTFLFSNTHDSAWYLDDVSLVDSSANQKITNGWFESSTASWWDGSNGPCNNTGTPYGITTSRSHSGSRCYYDRCTPSEVWVAQAFNATVGMTYTLRFWVFLKYTYTGTTSDIWLSVAMN